MTEYNKQDLYDVGESLHNLLEAVTGDGVDAGDLKKLIDTFTAGVSAVNEMKAVPEAATLHVTEKLAGLQGDKFMMKAVEAGEITLPPSSG